MTRVHHPVVRSHIGDHNGFDEGSKRSWHDKRDRQWEERRVDRLVYYCSSVFKRDGLTWWAHEDKLDVPPRSRASCVCLLRAGGATQKRVCMMCNTSEGVCTARCECECRWGWWGRTKPIRDKAEKSEEGERGGDADPLVGLAAADSDQGVAQSGAECWRGTSCVVASRA